ncbi:hypothetical protein H1R20_g10122, partial [Candolleomyces eurysporus]
MDSFTSITALLSNTAADDVVAVSIPTDEENKKQFSGGYCTIA